jgi:hypothetical protein
MRATSWLVRRATNSNHSLLSIASPSEYLPVHLVVPASVGLQMVNNEAKPVSGSSRRFSELD